MRKNAEAGQVLPLAAVALLGCVLLTLALVKAVLLLDARTRLQTAADATSLSAATAYARGLNVAAASNDLLIGAAGTDLLMKLFGSSLVKLGAKVPAKMAKKALPGSFTDMVVMFQDLWAGTGGTAPSAGVAPLFMQATALGTGAQNGLVVVALWNGRVDPGGMMPDLNLRRCDVYDYAAWLMGSDLGPRGNTGKGTVRVARKETQESFSYVDHSTGRTVTLSRQQVERVTFQRRGREYTTWRIREKAGKFLKISRATKEVMEFFDVPFPLIERTPEHGILVVGVRAGTLGTARLVPVASRADASGGEVFNGLAGDAGFEARLVRTGAGTADYTALLGLLSSPEEWKAWAASAAVGMAEDWASAQLWKAARKRLPAI